MPISKERLAEIDVLRDEDVDASEIPELDERFFETARLVMPTTKKTVTMRMDEDVLEWFRAEGKGHLTRMNAVLRAYMLSQRTDRHGQGE